MKSKLQKEQLKLLKWVEKIYLTHSLVDARELIEQKIKEIKQ